MLDARLRSRALNTGRRGAWFMDQYRHPHESRHSIDEVVGWFGRSGIDLVLTIPPLGGEQFTEDTELFRPRPPRT
jgi:hypothetical protein